MAFDWVYSGYLVVYYGADTLHLWTLGMYRISSYSWLDIQPLFNIQSGSGKKHKLMDG